MREEISLRWNEFGDYIHQLRDKYGYHEISLSEEKNLKIKNKVLFRGQRDSSWEIKTTLERKTQKRISVIQYLTQANKYSKEIEAMTEQTWDTLTYPELVQKIDETHDSFRVFLPTYGYLVYLRQYGFPSPLLDWTESPFIAAFFAFWEDSMPVSNEVAIYAYIESTEGVTGGWEGEPMISVFGPNVKTKKRHFSQKSWYTIATQWDKENKKHFFCSHETVFDNQNPDQDIIIKIKIPYSDRLEALRDLSDFNINPYTLFQTEDMLVKAIELKIFDLNDYWIE